MSNKSKNRRPQTSKAVRARSLETRAMLLRNGDGFHGKSGYDRANEKRNWRNDL